MSGTAESARREALALPPIDRAALVDDLLESIDRADPTIDGLWVEEARRRFDAYKEGRMDAIDAESVFAELD